MQEGDRAGTLHPKDYAGSCQRDMWDDPRDYTVGPIEVVPLTLASYNIKKMRDLPPSIPLVLVLICTALLVSPARAATQDRPWWLDPFAQSAEPFERGCASLVIDVSRTDRTSAVARSHPHCGELRLLLAGQPRTTPRLTELGERIVDFRVEIPVVVQNTSTEPLRVPVWLYAPEDHFIVFVGEKQGEHILNRHQYAGFPWRGSDERWEEFGEHFDQTRLKMWRAGMPGQDLSIPSVLPPEATTEVKWVTVDFRRNPSDSVRIAFDLRALHPAPLIPTTVPIVQRDQVLQGARVITPARAFPVPVAAELVRLRFRPGTSRTARQLVLDRIQGQICCALPGLGSEPDYLVRIPSGSQAGDESGVFAVVSRLRRSDLWGIVHRAGLLLAAAPPPPRSVAPLELRDTTLLMARSFDPTEDHEVRRRVIYVGFQEATPEEVAEALALVGGHQLESLPNAMGGEPVEIVGTAADAERAIAVLEWLPQVAAALVNFLLPLEPGAEDAHGLAADPNDTEPPQARSLHALARAARRCRADLPSVDYPVACVPCDRGRRGDPVIRRRKPRRYIAAL